MTAVDLSLDCGDVKTSSLYLYRLVLDDLEQIAKETHHEGKLGISTGNIQDG